MQKIDERNDAEIQAGGSATHSITIFADLSEDEFKQFKLGFKEKSPDDTIKFIEEKGKQFEFAEAIDSVSSTVTKGLTSWIGVYTTPIKDQG